MIDISDTPGDVLTSWTIGSHKYYTTGEVTTLLKKGDPIARISHILCEL